MPETFHDRVLIIGSGPAGYAAAIYAARASLSPRMVTGIQPGGQLTITTDVENYPGFADVIQGPWLMEQMRAQAEHVGAAITHDLIVDVDFTLRSFRCVGDSGDIYLADAVIIATGAKARWLGLPSEEKFMGFGVSACATCDGFFYRDKEVMVIGGGNTAVEEAIYLTNHAAKVYLVHRRNELRSEKILQERLFANPKIEPIWDTVLEEVVGDSDPPGVTAAILRNMQTGEVTEKPVDGIFVAIGHDPATSIFRGKVGMDDDGYIRTEPNSTLTDVPGVFAAGDVTDKVYRQAVTAAGLGCMAALDVEKFLAEREAIMPMAAE
ncbi:MAG: thioredoxin-disulfide reductase [Rhodospirillaceae bacterium]|nr:thioredoxin-disulfide reductase [Rhodospirillaceae bacterium]MCY4311712.1 thioredoxin-disulfide reductase [Rhodospirillaceae bacterium]